jgi:hypothetical protein
VALSNFMRLSLRQGAYAALSRTAWQEIRVRSGRDDKGEGDASIAFSRWLENPIGERSLLHVEEAALDCDHDCMRTITGSEFGENALEMSFDGVL